MFLICDKKGSTVTQNELLKILSPNKKIARDVINWKADYKKNKLYSPKRAKATIERAERAISELGKNVPFIIVYYGSDYAGGWQSLDVPLRTITTIDRFGLVTWENDEPFIRMLQPDELLLAMGGGEEHILPFGNRRNKVKLCGNGVCSDVMTSIFKWINLKQNESGNIE